jgi:hypothetical protein
MQQRSARYLWVEHLVREEVEWYQIRVGAHQVIHMQAIIHCFCLAWFCVVLPIPSHATHPHILPTIIYASSHLLHFFLLMPFHFHAHAQPLLTSCK